MDTLDRIKLQPLYIKKKGATATTATIANDMLDRSLEAAPVGRGLLMVGVALEVVLRPTVAVALEV